MKIHHKILALMLSVLLCISAIICVNAANKDLAPVEAKTGLEAIGISPNTEMISENTKSVTLPARYQSDTLGYTLPVRNQVSYLCWAYGTLSTMETLLLSRGYQVDTFAPLHTGYWGITREDGTGWQRTVTSAGYSYIPLGYLTSWAGPVNETDFPEDSNKSDYNSFNASPRYGLTEAVYFNSTNDASTIKKLIYTYGAVTCNFNANMSYISSDGTAFYCANDEYTIQQLSGHCVSCVGWDDNFAKENFEGSASGIPENDGAWLVKNSWGENTNSMGGYYWISYEDAWVFDEIFGPSYALTDFEIINENMHLYQNEVDGATYEFDYADRTGNLKVTYMNVFDFEKENRVLDKVVFESTSVGSDYTVYYIPMDGNTPTTERLLWTKLAEGTITYAGYHCADIKNTELPDGKGAIAVTVDNTDYYNENKNKPNYTPVLNSIGVCEWLSTGGRYIFYPQAEKGLSYLYYNGQLMDVMDYYSSYMNDDIGGTFVIKAITQNEAELPTEPDTDATENSTFTENTACTDDTDSTNEATENTTDSEESSIPTTESAPSSDATEDTQNTAESESHSATPPFEVDDPFTFLLGDADLNGKINIKDATLIQKHSASLVTLTDREKMAADTNHNDVVNVVDATSIQKFVAGIAVKDDIGKTQIHFE